MATLKHFIFDLDGTLIDSLEDLKASINYSFRVMGVPERSTEDVRIAIGNGALKLIIDLLPEEYKHRSDEAFELFLPHYNEHCSKQTHIYEGVIEYLELVSSHPEITTTLITNKPEVPTKIILERLNLVKYFDLVIGGDTLETRKPDPEGILFSMNRFSASAEETVMIGDSTPDMKAAQAAGVHSVGIAQGYGTSDINPTWTITEFKEINSLNLL